MQTDALDLAERHAQTGHAERLTWGVIEIQVTDLDRAAGYWTSVIGLYERPHAGSGIALGTQDKTLVVLHSGATVAAAPKHLGMYHVAIGVPDQAEFSRLLARFLKMGVQIAPTDHLMSKSIYFRDPDGLEIEIVYETPERFGRFGDLSKGLVLYDVNDTPHNGRSALDVESELKHAQGADLDAAISDDAFLAHMHFKVDSLDTASEWFKGIGFAQNLILRDWGFADMGAGAPFTHRLAMNTWAGPGMRPAPANMARLLRYSLLVHDPDVTPGVTSLQDDLTGVDPMGTEITLIPTY